MEKGDKLDRFIYERLIDSSFYAPNRLVVPYYSGEPELALIVAEKLREKGYRTMILSGHTKSQWTCSITNEDGSMLGSATSPEFAEAIALATYHALKDQPRVVLER